MLRSLGVCRGRTVALQCLASRKSVRRSAGRLRAMSCIACYTSVAADHGGWGIHNHLAYLAYDGTAYKGFQVQNHTCRKVATVQQRVEEAVCQISQQSPSSLRMQSAGRTDTGVHARGQAVNFYLFKQIDDCGTARFQLNRLLPPSIRVTHLQRVPPDFHCRYSALSKVYHYTVCTAAVQDPFTHRYSLHCSAELDLDSVRLAAAFFEGRHDFSHFCNIPKPAQRDKWNPVKLIKRFAIVDQPDGFHVEIEGTGFLWKQCRHMVGALLAVGQGKLSLEDIKQRLAAGREQGPGAAWRGWNTAAPQGLCLMSVQYVPHDNVNILCHPDELVHDSFGRPAIPVSPQSPQSVG